MPNRPVRQLVKNQTILTASATLSVADAAARMRDAKVGAIMVLNGARLVGIFTERDALYRVVAAGKDPGRTTLADVMTCIPSKTNGCRKDSMIRIAQPSTCSMVSGCLTRTANSSPPSRAIKSLSSTHSSIRRATSHNNLSPTGWPNVSLTALN